MVSSKNKFIVTRIGGQYSLWLGKMPTCSCNTSAIATKSCNSYTVPQATRSVIAIQFCRQPGLIRVLKWVVTFFSAEHVAHKFGYCVACCIVSDGGLLSWHSVYGHLSVVQVVQSVNQLFQASPTRSLPLEHCKWVWL